MTHYPHIPYSDVQLMHKSYQHFEQLRDEAMVWDLDFRQMGPGEGGHRLLQLAGREFNFVYCVFSCAYDQRSVGPAGLRTFSILAEDRAPSTWCGSKFGWNTFVSMPVGDEFRALSSGYFSNYVFSLAESVLEATAEFQYGARWEALAPDSSGALFEFDAPSMILLRKVLRGLTEEAASQGQAVNYIAPTGEIASLVVRGLQRAKPEQPRRAERNRQRYFHAAQDYIDHSVDAPILMKDICEAVGVSERTLEYAFREHQHISPKAYLNRQRLSRIRKILVAQTAGATSISEVANQFGLWHMGQFARDYRNLYGEKPSETLARDHGVDGESGWPVSIT